MKTENIKELSVISCTYCQKTLPKREFYVFYEQDVSKHMWFCDKECLVKWLERMEEQDA